MAVWLLNRTEVAGRLAQFGCEFIEEVVNPRDDYYAFSYWRTSWGYHFTVPLVGPDRLCAEYHLYEILADLAARAHEHQSHS